MRMNCYEDRQSCCNDAILDWLNGIGERPCSGRGDSVWQDGFDECRRHCGSSWEDVCEGRRKLCGSVWEDACFGCKKQRICCDFCWLRDRCPYREERRGKKRD
jgi:hypothetical protein